MTQDAGVRPDARLSIAKRMPSLNISDLVSGDKEGTRFLNVDFAGFDAGGCASWLFVSSGRRSSALIAFGTWLLSSSQASLSIRHIENLRTPITAYAAYTRRYV